MHTSPMVGELTWDLRSLPTAYGLWLVSSLLLLLLGSIIFLERAWAANDHDRPQVRRRHRGPKIYPLVGSQLEIARNLDHLYDWAAAYLREDPTNTIRMKGAFTSGYIVSTVNPQNLEHILKTNFANYPKGETVLEAFKPLLGDGIFNADGEVWKFQRKVAVTEFSSKTMRDFIIDLIQRETYNRLLPLLAKAHSEGSVIDIQDVFMRFGFDNICLLAFGLDMGCLDLSLPEIEFVSAYGDAARLTFRRMLVPRFLYPFLDFLAFLGIGSGSKLRSSVRVVDRFALSIIEKRRKELKSRANHEESPTLEHQMASKFSSRGSDLLSRFLQHDEETHQEEASGKSVKSSNKYLRDIVLNFVLAGRDSSSIALTWFFWLLPQHPEVEKKMVDEVTSIIQARNGSLQEHDSAAKMEGFTYDELREMHYIQATITESMRLYPPIPVESKSALADDCLPDGTFVRKGDRVAFNIYAMGRMESVWGKDCLEFKPQRFLQDGRFVPENSFRYPVFQAGPRTCLGKEMAYTQMKYVLAAILISPYRFQLLSKPSPKGELSLSFQMKEGLLSRVRKV
ncbi:hypothetical protein R1flu_019668 [Riccia fluitans]|uniref:Cytochrome P450 n=1 Tax=Riccia fluitans TaxID=41844 RepID=A0ABD1ZJB6_9MARC